MSISVLNSDAGLAGTTLLNGESAQTVTGLKTFDRDPSAPFAVSSGSAVVTNLDADTVDGVHAADFVSSASTQVANRVLAGPTTGADAAPTFRALVTADMPAAIKAKAYKAAAQSIADNTATVITLDTEIFDTDTIHDTVTNNSRLTCKTAGNYTIVATIRWGNQNNGQRRTEILKNGSVVLAEAESQAPGSGNGTVRQTVSAIEDLAVNDYVEIRVLQDRGGATDVEAAGSRTPSLAMVRNGA
jgi:hypothetical protein